MAYGSAAKQQLSHSYSSLSQTSGTTVTSHSSPLPMASATPLNPAQPEPTQRLNDKADRLITYVRTTWQDCRPWSEFYSTRLISLPTFAALSDRFSMNVHVYRANYQVVASFWLLCVLLRSILSFIAAAILFLCLESWAFRKAAKNSNFLLPADKVVILFAALLIIWMTDIGSYTVTSIFISAVSISIHAIVHQPGAVDTDVATV